MRRLLAVLLAAGLIILAMRANRLWLIPTGTASPLPTGTWTGGRPPIHDANHDAFPGGQPDHSHPRPERLLRLG